MSTRPAPRAPEIPGTRTLGPSDADLLNRWARIGYRYGGSRGSWWARGFSWVVWLISWPTALLTKAVHRGDLRRQYNRYYLSPAGDATLAVKANRHGWTLADHLSQAPGTGAGQHLQDLLLPHLLRVADQANITIKINAANQTLADRYMAKIPDLVDVGRAFPRGRRLVRAPQPTQTLS